MKLKEIYSHYLILAERWRAVEIVGSLILSLIAANSAYNIIMAFFSNFDTLGNELFTRSEIAIVMHLVILVLCVARIVALLKNIKISLYIWILLMVSIGLYATITAIIFETWKYREYSCIDCMYYDTFLFSSAAFMIFFTLYPMISALKEVILILMSAFHIHRSPASDI